MPQGMEVQVLSRAQQLKSAKPVFLCTGEDLKTGLSEGEGDWVEGFASRQKPVTKSYYVRRKVSLFNNKTASYKACGFTVHTLGVLLAYLRPCSRLMRDENPYVIESFVVGEMDLLSDASYGSTHTRILDVLFRADSF